MARKKHEKKTTKNGANLGFEPAMWQAADKLRGNMDASDYKHVVLGLIFLKYISDAFEERHASLKNEPHANPEDRDEYSAENVFWAPKPARWPKLQASAKQPGIGKLLDEAMLALEKDNPGLKGVLPKDYARESLDKHRLGALSLPRHHCVVEPVVGQSLVALVVANENIRAPLQQGPDGAR